MCIANPKIKLKAHCHVAGGLFEEEGVCPPMRCNNFAGDKMFPQANFSKCNTDNGPILPENCKPTCKNGYRGNVSVTCNSNLIFDFYPNCVIIEQKGKKLK